MAVGVPDTEVYAAADAVLARGERPTVERVRAELGRGSPARVGKLLESWWDALAKRLAGETRLPELPAEVATAFGSVWAAACEAANTTAQADLASEREDLASERRRFEEERQTAQLAIEASKADADAAQRAVAAAERRLVDQDARIAEQGRQLEELREEHVASRAREAALREERDSARSQLSASEAAWTAEREGLAAHLRTTEDRAHTEIDRVREEAKRLSKALADLQRSSSTTIESWRQQFEQLQSAHHGAQQEVASLAARAKTLDAQLARMDGLPAALLAAQNALAESGRRLDVLQRQSTTSSKVRTVAKSARGRKGASPP